MNVPCEANHLGRKSGAGSRLSPSQFKRRRESALAFGPVQKDDRIATFDLSFGTALKPSLPSGGFCYFGVGLLSRYPFNQRLTPATMTQNAVGRNTARHNT